MAEPQNLPAWVNYLQALGPFMIGIFVAYVAWRQWKSNHQKLKFDIFEKRYDIYKMIIDFSSELTRNGQNWLDFGEVHRFRKQINTYKFLFFKNIEIEKLVRGVIQDGFDICSHNNEIRDLEDRINHPRDAFTLPINYSKEDKLHAIEKNDLKAKENIENAEKLMSKLRKENREILTRNMKIDRRLEDLMGAYIGFEEYGVSFIKRLYNWRS